MSARLKRNIAVGILAAFLLIASVMLVKLYLSFGDSQNNPITEVVSDNVGSPRRSVPESVIALPVERSYVSDNSAGIFSDVPDSEIDHQAVGALLERAPVAAYAVVRVNGDLLRTYIRDPRQHPSIRFEAFGLEPMMLVTDTRFSEEHNSGWQLGLASWVGKIEGDEASSASFVISYDSTVTGYIRAYRDSKVHRIKIDQIKGTNQQLMWYVDPDHRSPRDDSPPHPSQLSPTNPQRKQKD